MYKYCKFAKCFDCIKSELVPEKQVKCNEKWTKPLPSTPFNRKQNATTSGQCTKRMPLVLLIDCLKQDSRKVFVIRLKKVYRTALVIRVTQKRILKDFCLVYKICHQCEPEVTDLEVPEKQKIIESDVEEVEILEPTPLVDHDGEQIAKDILSEVLRNLALQEPKDELSLELSSPSSIDTATYESQLRTLENNISIIDQTGIEPSIFLNDVRFVLIGSSGNVKISNFPFVPEKFITELTQIEEATDIDTDTDDVLSSPVETAQVQKPKVRKLARARKPAVRPSFEIKNAQIQELFLLTPELCSSVLPCEEKVWSKSEFFSPNLAWNEVQIVFKYPEAPSESETCEEFVQTEDIPNLSVALGTQTLSKKAKKKKKKRITFDWNPLVQGNLINNSAQDVCLTIDVLSFALLNQKRVQASSGKAQFLYDAVCDLIFECEEILCRVQTRNSQLSSAAQKCTCDFIASSEVALFHQNLIFKILSKTVFLLKAQNSATLNCELYQLINHYILKTALSMVINPKASEEMSSLMLTHFVKTLCPLNHEHNFLAKFIMSKLLQQFDLN